MFDDSIALARRAGSTHELALALSAKHWADGTADGAEAEQLLARLGVVWTPILPSKAVTAAQLPGQRREKVRTSSSAGRPAATGS